jgi:hypothetical protein
LVTGSRVRKEVPRSPVAKLATTYLVKRIDQRVVEAHLLVHPLDRSGSMVERPSAICRR